MKDLKNPVAAWGAVISLFFVLIGCSSFLRSSSSGYSNGGANDHASDSGDANHSRTRKLPPENQKLYLSQLENSIPTKEEVSQYSKLLPLFKNDAEKIEYLSLPSFEDKQHWVRDHRISDRANQNRDDYKDALDAQDIAVGMPIDLVRQAWGEPEQVEVSGKAEFKNERWHYHKMISTPSGYRSEKRVVDFEGGRVAGWEVR